MEGDGDLEDGEMEGLGEWDGYWELRFGDGRRGGSFGGLDKLLRVELD